jgi:hypothetical protein
MYSLPDLVKECKGRRFGLVGGLDYQKALAVGCDVALKGRDPSRGSVARAEQFAVP